MHDDDVPQPRRNWVWPYGALATAIFVCMAPTLTSMHKPVAGDVFLQHYPLQVLLRNSLARGEFPFWNPYTLGGIPAFANPIAGYTYLPHWLTIWLPAIPALNWTIAFHVALAGIGVAWCVGRMGAGPDGQFLAGITYALGSAMTQRLWAGHLGWIEANAWLPFGVGLSLDLRRRRSVAALAVTVAMIVTAGRPEMFLFAVWSLPLWAGVAALRSEPRQVIAAVARVCVGLVSGLGLAAVHVLPFAAVFAASNRAAGLSWEAQTLSSLPPWHLLTLLGPTVFGAPGGESQYWAGTWFDWHERLLYLGTVPLLAAAAIRGPWRVMCWSLAAAAVALSFGRFVPWYAWVRAFMPGYEAFRVPPKHLVLAALALALAAGLGVENLRGKRVAGAAWCAAAVLGVALVTIGDWLPAFANATGTELLSMPSTQQMAASATRGFLTAVLMLVLAGGAAVLPGAWPIRAMLLLATLDLGWTLFPFRNRLIDPAPTLQMGEALRGLGRAAVLGSEGIPLGQLAPLLEVTLPSGYDPIVSRGYATLLLGAKNPDALVFQVTRGDDRLLRLLGIGKVLSMDQSITSLPGAPPPLAWVSDCVWPGGAEQVSRPDFPTAACIALPRVGLQEEPRPPRPVEVLAQGAGWLRVRATGPGWLVTTQPWYPGWRGRVDGMSADTSIVDGALVGMQLPQGAHDIYLWYRPEGLATGLMLSLLSALLLVAVCTGPRWARPLLGRVREGSGQRRGTTNSDGG